MRGPIPCWLAALLGTALLPWNMQQDGVTLAGLWAWGAEDAEAASALWQAVAHGRWWFWPVSAALILALPGLRGAAGWQVAAGALGLAAVIGQGLAIGVQGWRWAWLEGAFGPLEDRQFGIGLGGTVTLLGFLFLLTGGLARRGLFRGDRFVAGGVGLLALCILVFTAWPVTTMLAQVLTPREDLPAWAALGERIADRRIWGLGCLAGGGCGVFWNTLLLGISTATAATALGLCFALVVTRTGFPARRALRLLTVLPIITPPFVIGLGLILIFGRSGLVNQAADAWFGLQLGRWIYGFDGMLLAQVFSFTPTAFLVLIGVVEGVSPTMEEASQVLRASRLRGFRTVTLPLMRPGLANAWLVVFVESLADFGNPIILGGSTGVLSTEIFFAVVGAQQDFGRAAALAGVMLALALGAFLLQRAVLGRRSYVSMTGKGDAGIPAPLPPLVRRLCHGVALPWATLTVTVYAMALAGGFVRVWGRDWTPTLSHLLRAFALERTADGRLLFTGGAWSSLATTVELAAIAAPLTALLGLLAAWILSRHRFPGRTALEFAVMLTFAVPGTVIGVAYILTYNIPPLEITGTAVILVACFVFRNLPVGVRTGVAAMSQIDRSLDEAALTLRASTFRVLRTVVLPLLRPAIVTALVYSFVRAMTTVSAAIFLVSAEHEMATVFIINRVINGDYGLAIAYCAVLILLMAGAIALIQLLVGQRRLGRRAPVVAAPVAGRA
ncbi:ABC transporter permease [Paracraurococcus ruber]|uniref:Iron ABC transporter permease n=1 Tax=Paracraurococcus ruber TaxID=77675 RepID=A0ABS1CS82_9PROT|nr:iron ABC transporter permease [Paracraurococcus ruber]MBK1657213.1 iron ABC transporter permease [Paracraurococcus ruber]TDG32563.1 iron ABC transporter permease [Paracraurococcus ruber]